jgi:hypothetical protein
VTNPKEESMTETKRDPMRLKRMRFKPSIADQIRVRYEDNISEAIRGAVTRYADGATLPPLPEKEYADTALASFMPKDVFDDAMKRAKDEGRRLPDVVAQLLLADD